MSMIFRAATNSDLPEMQKLYIETTEEVCKNDYNKEQLRVWSSGVENTERWLDLVHSQFVLLAII